ncbi:MAG: HIT family protein [Candidatus Omnitrophica bacterium]|nr:HIT family protein [Candidatus Omnitrophota bacterium]
MASLFTRIINGEIPCHKICEDENYFAFLEIRPINPGHTLVVPKKEVDYLFDADDECLGGMMVFAKKIAPAIEKAVECKRLGVMVAGLEVPHAHIHLIPITRLGDLNFDNQQPAENDDLARVAEEIREHL